MFPCHLRDAVRRASHERHTCATTKQLPHERQTKPGSAAGDRDSRPAKRSDESLESIRSMEWLQVEIPVPVEPSRVMSCFGTARQL